MVGDRDSSEEVGRSLNLLLVEDSEADADLLLRALTREGYQIKQRRVQTAQAMRAALREQPWQVVVADYTLPRFGAMDALEILRESGMDLPFIIVTGSVGEETAAHAMKAGAHDFFLKDRLARLGSAIDREMREADVRRQRRAAADQLRESEQQLRQALQARDEFLSIASHELKTPLTALALELMMIHRMARESRNLQSVLTPEQLEPRLGRTVRHVERLTNLINNLLDVTRITSGRLTLFRSPLDIRELLLGLVDRSQAAISDSGSEVKVHGDEPLVGLWDPSAIETVLTNLLSNALKYGEGKPIEIRLRRIGGMARLSVSDGGIGIAPEEQNRIFQRFERAVPAEHYGGFGIGLWVARQVVEAHGGTIQVSSAPGKGSTFVVELPLQPEAEAPSPAGHEPEEGQAARPSADRASRTTVGPTTRQGRGHTRFGQPVNAPPARVRAPAAGKRPTRQQPRQPRRGRSTRLVHSAA